MKASGWLFGQNKSFEFLVNFLFNPVKASVSGLR
jgi:hypothetical protein